MMRLTLCVLIALSLACSSAVAAETQQTAAGWTADDIERCRRSSSVGPAKGGGLTLVDRDLIQYEIGRTVHAADRRAACRGRRRRDRDERAGPAGSAASLRQA